MATSNFVRKQSVVRSSRQMSIDHVESDTRNLKVGFGRTTRSRSRSLEFESLIPEIVPSPAQSVKGKAGYNLRFHVPTVESKKTSSKLSKQFQIPPENIRLSAVRYSLYHKGFVTNSHSWQGEMLFETESECLSNQGQTNGVNFKGKLQSVGKPNLMHFTNPNDANMHISLMVAAPSTTTSNTSMLWSWPWLDRTLQALELYQSKGDEPNCIENQKKHLPKLSCPLQGKMLLRYLKSAGPLLTETELQETKRLVEEFALKYGATFHDLLFTMSTNHDNWIHSSLSNANNTFSWEESPLINLGIIAPFCHDLWPEQENSMLHRSCQIIRFVVEFWQLIRKQKLKAFTDDKGYSLCMREFLYLFNSVRVPGRPEAAICAFLKTAQAGDSPRNIIVIHRGLIFSMNVVDESLELLSSDHIENSLKEVMLFASKNEATSVSILTAAHMAAWCATRQHLMRLSENNSAILMEIEQAIFVLSLDHKNVRGLEKLANESLFADGCNRWYDKSLNVYVHNNGFVTVNANRTLLEGPTVAHLLNYVHLRILEESNEWVDDEISAAESSAANATPVTSPKRLLSNAEEILLQASKLEKSTHKSGIDLRLNSLTATEAQALYFDIDDWIEEEIQGCASRFTYLSSSLLTAVSKHDVLDEQFFSCQRIDKDSFAHMILHFTFYKMYYRIASVGCKVSLKRFYNAPYDILRSTTSEMADWCKAMLNSDYGEKQKEALFRKAEKAHRYLLEECYNGEGCDNYMNALKNLAVEYSIPPGNMFDNEVFERTGGDENFDISLESLGMECTSCPVIVPHKRSGYGVGYSVATSFIMFCVSSWDQEVGTNAQLFATSINMNIDILIKCINRWNCINEPPITG